MLITITNRTNSVRLNYNDVAAPNIFSKKRSIMKSAVRHLKLSHDESYVEVTYTDDTHEQFSYQLFEGMADNNALFEALDAMIQ